MKGILISHEDGGSYVMDRNGDFRFVKGFEDQQLGTEISFGEKVRLKRSPDKIILQVASVAACFVLLISLGTFVYLWNAPSFYAYVDINPSVEIEFNHYAQVKSVTSLNEDGEELLEDLELKGDPMQAIDALIAAAQEQGYEAKSPGGRPGMSVMISIPEGSGLVSLVDKINTALTGLADGGAQVDICTEAERLAALELGTTPGILKLAEKWQVIDPELTLEEILSLSVAEINDGIQDARQMLESRNENSDKKDGSDSSAPADG